MWVYHWFETLFKFFICESAESLKHISLEYFVYRRMGKNDTRSGADSWKSCDYMRNAKLPPNDVARKSWRRSSRERADSLQRNIVTTRYKHTRIHITAHRKFMLPSYIHRAVLHQKKRLSDRKHATRSTILTWQPACNEQFCIWYVIIFIINC